MTPPRFERIREIFLAVSEAHPNERASLMRSMCDGDDALRAEVESLLTSATAASFLEPTIPHAHPSDPPTPPAVPLEMPKSVGPYKLLQVIGEGGFGVVYMAEQEHPVRRRVALKLIRLGMDTKHILARFEAERQALAMMDHPNIARVLDAGASDSGRPYFVMELVRGVPITQYCDHEKLDTRARLNLFIAVCRAVQHAHHKGIIHRDIKPSNVMVTLHDGVPIPKVIDFGIAKATNARLTERTLFTEFHQFIGTPEYMSPEQAEMSGLDVDTRSDIYSLGVLLYELLSGVTPLDGARLRSEGWAGMQKLIRDFEPIRPSFRLSGASEATTAAARNRGVGIAELKRSLAGDLDWIVLRALEKDRTRRYETAAAVAADIERFLRDEPIEARPPSVAYRARKFIRRNAAPVAIASLIVIGLVISATALGLLYTRQRAASHRALAAEANERALRERAQENLDRAEQSESSARAALERSDRVKELLKSALGAGSFNEAGWSRETKASDVLDRFQKTLGAHEAADPEVMAELFGVLSDSYVQLGMSNQALLAARRRLELARPIWSPGDPRVVDALLDLAWIESEAGSTESSRDAVNEVLALRDPEAPTPAALIRAHYLLGNISANAADAERAIDLYQRALALCHDNPGASTGGPAGIRDGLANALFQASRFEESLALSNEITREEPLESPASFNLLRRWHRHAGRLWDLGRTTEAIDAMRRIAEISDQTLGPQHAGTTSRWHALATWLVAVNQPEAATAILDRLLSVVDAEHRTIEHAKMLKVAAWAEFALNHPDRAESRLHEAIDVARSNNLTGFDAPGFLWRDAQVWRLTLDHSAWADNAIRRAISQVVNDHLTGLEPAPERADDWIDWSALSFALARHADNPHSPPDTGSLTDLHALRDLEPGLYAIRITTPLELGAPVECTGWFLIAEWDITEFALDGYTPDHPERWAAAASTPDIHRTDRTLDDPFDAVRPADRIMRTVGYGLIAHAMPSLPTGRYDIAVSSDDGERFSIGETRILDGWYGRQDTTDSITITHEASHPEPWTLEYFQGADSASLRFHIEPADPAARAATLARLGIDAPAQ